MKWNPKNIEIKQVMNIYLIYVEKDYSMKFKVIYDLFTFFFLNFIASFNFKFFIYKCLKSIYYYVYKKYLKKKKKNQSLRNGPFDFRGGGGGGGLFFFLEPFIYLFIFAWQGKQYIFFQTDEEPKYFFLQ